MPKTGKENVRAAKWSEMGQDNLDNIDANHISSSGLRGDGHVRLYDTVIKIVETGSDRSKVKW